MTSYDLSKIAMALIGIAVMFWGCSIFGGAFDKNVLSTTAEIYRAFLFGLPGLALVLIVGHMEIRDLRLARARAGKR